MPREVTDHGLSGYRRGCKCAACRAAHAKAVKDWRARKKADQAPKPAVERPLPEPLSSAPALDPEAPPGRLEQLLTLDLAQQGGERTYKGFLSGLVLYNARLLDQLPRLDRLDLISSVESRTLDILARLAPPGRPGEGGVTDEALEKFLSGLTSASE